MVVRDSPYVAIHWLPDEGGGTVKIGMETDLKRWSAFSFGGSTGMLDSYGIAGFYDGVSAGDGLSSCPFDPRRDPPRAFAAQNHQ